jgi:hypothetical protein
MRWSSLTPLRPFWSARYLPHMGQTLFVSAEAVETEARRILQEDLSLAEHQR